MDYSTQLVLLVLCTKCVAVNIKRMDVPSSVKVGTESVVLDCEYDIEPMSPAGLVVKWFFNGSSGLVYQWIPPLQPQVIGLLKGKVDINFKISEEPLQVYRAIRILRPSTDLSGNYTCVVSTFMKEDRQTRPMVVYSTGKSFDFVQEKRYVFLVTLVCVAVDLYPKPVIDISSQGISLKQTESEYVMNSWGLYTVTAKAVVHDDDVQIPHEQFVCTLTLPNTNYTANRSTIYYPGLMPTAYITALEVEKPQERLGNDCTVQNSSNVVMLSIVTLILNYFHFYFSHNYLIDY